MSDSPFDDPDLGDLSVSPAPPTDTSAAIIADPGGKKILVPVMNSEDTLRKKSSHGHKLQEIALPNGIKMKEFKDVISGTYLAYTNSGSGASPRPEEVAEYVDVPVRRIQIIMATPQFKAAVYARGITFEGNHGLTRQQDYALMILLDPTQGAGLKERLRKAGITMATYRAWMKNPIFREYIDTVGNGILKELESDIMVSVAGRAAEGDFQSAKFVLEMSGRYNPNDRQVMDMQVFMASVMEIIKERITDPDTLKAIGTDMMLLSSRAGISDARQIGA